MGEECSTHGTKSQTFGGNPEGNEIDHLDKSNFILKIQDMNCNHLAQDKFQCLATTIMYVPSVVIKTRNMLISQATIDCRGLCSMELVGWLKGVM